MTPPRLQTATKAHVSGKVIGKGVLVRLNGLRAAPLGTGPKGSGERQNSKVIMCILRATDRVQLGRVAKLMQAESADLCKEAEVNVRHASLPLYSACKSDADRSLTCAASEPRHVTLLGSA